MVENSYSESDSACGSRRRSRGQKPEQILNRQGAKIAKKFKFSDKETKYLSGE